MNRSHKFNRRAVRWNTLIARICIPFFACAAMFPQAVHSIGIVRLSQLTGIVGTPTTITVTATITDPTLMDNSVNLLRVNSDGTTTILGVMHDDGVNGDANAGDRVFSFVTTLNSSTETQILLQASAAFKGVLQRAKSSVIPFFIQNANAPQQALAALAQALIAGDITTALTYVVPSDKSTTALNTLGKPGLDALASMMQKAVPVNSSGDLRVFQTPVATPSGTANVEFTMLPGPDGKWLVNTW